MAATVRDADPTDRTGDFAGTYTITPSKCNTDPCTITDSDVQSELKAQITAMHLPAPDESSVYMINFPKGRTISLQGSNSCVVFCAYHSTSGYGTPPYLYYVVLPYMGSESGCYQQCDAGDDFTAQTTRAAHEILEPITDPAVGVATGNAAPLAWYDPCTGDSNPCGEIADICNAQQATIVGPHDVTYTVQKGWSNALNQCVATSTYALGDVSGDSKIDVADVFYLINRLFAGGLPPLGDADVNTDGNVDVSDGFYLINYLFAGGPAPF